MNSQNNSIKIVDERTFFTNDRKFEKKIPQRTIVQSRSIAIDRNQIITTDGLSDDSEINKSIEEMTAEEMRRHIKDKRNNNLPKTISKVLTSATSYVNSIVFKNSDKNDTISDNVKLEESKVLTLENLGCRTIDQAFQKYAKNGKKYLFKCPEINADNLVNQSIFIRELKHYGFSLFEINKKFNIRWIDICQKLKLNASDLSREDGWFDVKTLSDCVNVQRGNLIYDLQFSIDDIRRLKCADAEMSQLDIDFDKLCQIGFNKNDFKEFPWYPDTMANLLGLQSKHLSKNYLNLNRNDFAFLILNRGHWTFDFFIEELEMKESMVNFLFEYAKQCKQNNSIPIDHAVANVNLNSEIVYKQKNKKTLTLADLYASDEDDEQDKIHFKNVTKSKVSPSFNQTPSFQSYHQTENISEQFFGQTELQKREEEYRKQSKKMKKNGSLLTKNNNSNYSSTSYTHTNDINDKASGVTDNTEQIDFINSVESYDKDKCSRKTDHIVIL